MIKKITFLILFLVPIWLQAQYDAPVRIELEAAKDDNAYHHIAADTTGLFIFYEGNNLNEDSTTWIFIHYDTNFNKISHFIVPMPALTEFIASSRSKQYVYLFFQKRFPKKDPVQSLLLTINPQEGNYNIRKIKNLENNKINRIYVCDNQIAFLAQEEKKDRLYFYDFRQDKYEESYEGFEYRIEFCKADTFHQRWLVGLNEVRSNNAGELSLYIYPFQQKGAYIWPYPTHPENTFNSTRAITINADTTLLLGTYNTLHDKYSSNLHSGVYTFLWNDTLLTTPQFFNYSTLKSEESRAEHLNNKSTASNLNLQLLVAQPACGEQQYSLVTEVFYPEYNYNSGYNYYDTYGYYDMAYRQPTTTFAGYRFVNAYITTFDKNGNLLWDNYFPFTHQLDQTLRAHLKIHYIGHDALVLYPKNNSIVNTLLNNGKTVVKLSKFAIETNSQRDVIDYTRNTSVEHWYGNNYIASGYQYLYNKGKRSAKRYVFYLNKIQYW